MTCGETTSDVRSGESTFIPVETKHRLENCGNELLAIIEVQC
nr:mannose-6-phosphate isomerase [Pyrinomonadaceae bacterium]